MNRPTMKELAAQINAHLKRFESDPQINAPKPQSGLSPYYHAGAWYWRGSRMSVQYIGYQGPSSITRDEATRYLEKLDAGFVGRHFEALREVAA